MKVSTENDNNLQDYIYWIISTENDHRHHHKFIKYEKRLRKEGKNMFDLPIKQIICKYSASLDALSELLSWMTIFKSIHMAFYVNLSWACTLFRNNKQHVVLGQKRKWVDNIPLKDNTICFITLPLFSFYLSLFS
jgi:hypothetical protein